ncbi:MAG: hypothetical protein LBC97_16130 [Bifidobacteriaceae bacterium]|nr:hypothetical protein [Bifidobacteriaceae bacterium]
MDPRSVALDREWEECTARGMDFSGMRFSRTTPDGQEQILSNVAPLTRPSPGVAIDVTRGPGTNGEPVGEAGDWLLRGYPSQIEVALADYDCRQETHYMDRIMEIQRDVERNWSGGLG